MTNNKNIFVLVALVFIATFIVKDVSAQTSQLTDTQTRNIFANCTSIKNRLDQLHVNDALLRVNRGQIYETILSKLMIQFNKRYQSNGKDAAFLQSSTQKFSEQLEKFRKDYMLYEQQLDDTIRIGCSSDAQKFIENIELSRQYRKAVFDDLQQLNLYLDNYKSEFLKAKLLIEGQ